MDNEGTELAARLEATTTLLDKTLSWLEQKLAAASEFSSEVERISATVEQSRREEELGGKPTMNATFADIHAAADFIGPGAVEVPLYQTEIFDICRRSSPFGQRIKQVPATGHPSRFFEETALPNPGTAGFVNPRSIVAPVVSPTRVERSVPLKAIVSQIKYNLFDIELGNQQQQFAYLQAKDLVDTVSGVMVSHDVALWNGNDTSLSSPTTTQYMGVINQIVAGGNSVTIGTS